MPTGVIGKLTDYGDPPVVLNGTVATAAYGANLTATVNYLLTGAHSVWYPGMLWTAQTATIGSANTLTNVNITGGGTVRMPLVLPFSTNNTLTINSVTVYVNKVNTASTAINVFLTNPSVSDVNSGATASTTAGAQTIVVSGLSLTCDSTHFVWLQYANGQVGDLVGAVLVTYTGSG